MTAQQNALQFQEVIPAPQPDIEQSFSIGGRTFSVSLDGKKDGIKEAFLLESNIGSGSDDELLDDLNHMLSRGGRSTQVDLKNHATVSLPYGIEGTFTYSTHDVIANPKFADQVVQIPLDKMYEAHGRTYIFKGTEIVLPFATILYADGGSTNFINCPLKVAQDTEVSIAA